MLEYITLGLVVLKYVLDYVAPRTKTKVDDKLKQATDVLPLPSLPDAAKKAAEQMQKNEKPATPAKEVTGFGMARDHRK